jgi:hypothetical protein
MSTALQQTTHTIEDDPRARLVAALERRVEGLRKDVAERDAKIAQLTFALERAKTAWIELLRSRAADAL